MHKPLANLKDQEPAQEWQSNACPVLNSVVVALQTSLVYTDAAWLETNPLLWRFPLRAAIHHHDTINLILHQAQIMTDEQQSHTILRHQFRNER